MSDRWATLQQLLADGVQQGVYTAAVAVVGLQGELHWQGVAGRLSRDPAAPAATSDTIFDLASLTKPLATALALMILVTRQQLRLNISLGEILPPDWLPKDKQPLTLESLLTHRAGLAVWRPFFREVLAAPVENRPRMLARLAAATPLEHQPDTVTVYSDLGFMLLQAVVEEVAGTDLNQFCAAEIYRLLGLHNLGFISLLSPTANCQPETANRSYAATETGLIPDRSLAGQVHDENAWAAGGVAGHAGLFGTAREVFDLVAALSRAYQGEQVGPLSPEVVKLFLTVPNGAERALGFDTPGTGAAASSAGRFFSPASVGHLGFTGTSFWLDLNLGQMVVLLTNRVHLGRDDKAKIQAFRPRFHEAASRALGFSQSYRD